MAGELPLCLIESNILPRLPAKTVGRCMCVCKQWKSFLSAPTFARMHLHHVTINDYKLLVLDRPCEPLNDGSSTFRSNPSHDLGAKTYILASLDGLVCLVSLESRKLAFWNPLTGAYKRLASTPCNPLSHLNVVDVIGFYIDSSNDYKLLHLVHGGRFGAYIYSHKSDSWRKIRFLVDSNNLVCTSSSMAIFFDQCLYFTALDRKSNDFHRWIICFDVNTEKFRKIQCPSAPDGAKYCHSILVVLNERIHLRASYEKYDMMQVDLWRMEADDVGWVKVAASLGAKHNKFARHEYMASVDNWVAIFDDNNISLNKMDTRDFTTHLSDFCFMRRLFCVTDRMVYVETLVSPVNP